MLGFDEYWHGHDDGLQVLRYNQTKAYTPHMDYMTDRSGKELFVSHDPPQFIVDCHPLPFTRMNGENERERV